MSATIKLGSRPKNFKRIITVPLLDGTKGMMEVTFKYRTRKEFGAFIDGITAAAREAAKTEGAAEDVLSEDKPFSLAELMEKTADKNADYVMDVIEAWNLDVPLSKAAVEQLADETPAAVNTIMETYRVAVTEGRLGN